MLDYISLLILLFIICIIVYVVLKLSALPGNIAKRRNHPQEEAITVCGWLGLVTGGICWIVAFIWAHTSSTRKEQ